MFTQLFIQQALIAIAVIIASFIFGKTLKFLMNTLFKQLFSYTETILDDLLLDVVRGRVTTLSVIGGISIGIREMKKGLSFSQTTFLQILDDINIALFVILVFVLTRLIIKIIETVLNWYLEDVSQKTQSSITPTIAPLGTKIINVILFFIAGMIILDHFGINIGSLLVSLGVGSLAVALAAQETVANMIAGFVILIDQPFRVGDRVKLPSGEEGDVVQIGLRSTRILNFDNNLVVMPNGDLVKNKIINYSLPNRSTRVLIEIGISYDANVALAKEILLKIAHEHKDLLPDPPPLVLTASIGEFSILVRLIARTNDYGIRHLIEADIRESILRSFKEHNIEIPFPQRVIHLTKTDGTKTP